MQALYVALGIHRLLSLADLSTKVKIDELADVVLAVNGKDSVETSDVTMDNVMLVQIP